MPHYRRKPVIVAAWKWTGEECLDADADLRNVPVRHYEHDLSTGLSSAFIDTGHGLAALRPGDYLIRGIAGEWYPCRPEVFAELYAPVHDPSPPAPARGETREETPSSE